MKERRHMCTENIYWKEKKRERKKTFCRWKKRQAIKKTSRKMKMKKEKTSKKKGKKEKIMYVHSTRKRDRRGKKLTSKDTYERKEI